MNLPLLFSVWPLLLGLVGFDQVAVVRRVVINDQLTIRVPVQVRGQAPLEFRERKGPKCIAAASIGAAVLSGRNSVDFLLRDHRRLRADLDHDCPALDFYGGFYLQPEDDNLCADRDLIRSRMGGECRIDRFRLLEPRSRD